MHPLQLLKVAHSEALAPERRAQEVVYVGSCKLHAPQARQAPSGRPLRPQPWFSHPLLPRCPAPLCAPQFGAQEPGSNSEIKSFAERKGFKGPMFAKADVNGPNALPLFDYLKGQQVGAAPSRNRIQAAKQNEGSFQAGKPQAVFSGAGGHFGPWISGT